MKYARLYPSADFFQQVQENLFRNVDERACVVCGCMTFFLDYSVQEHPRALCSEECLWKFAEAAFPELSSSTKPEGE